MTNIAALTVKGNPRTNGNDYLVFAADSMGTFLGEGRKIDSSQKLFRLGNMFLMGTGSSAITNGLYDSLKPDELKIPSLGELTRHLKQALESTDLTPYGRGHGFIVGGHDGEKLAIHDINAQTQKGKKGTMVHVDDQSPSAFNGSGSPFVRSYLNENLKSGKYPLTLTPTQGLAHLFDFGKQGAQSSGVNESLQYGVIGPNGASRLYHPDISLTKVEDFNAYLAEMTGLPLAFAYYDTDKTMKHNNGVIDNNMITGDANAFLQTFYGCLNTDFSRNRSHSINYTNASEMLHGDVINTKGFRTISQARTTAERNLEQGVNAFIERDFEKMRAYVSNHFERQLGLAGSLANRYSDK